MSEIKTITAELTSVSQEAKRTVFSFINPDGSNYALKVGAFEPNVPNLKIGKTYTFPCEFKPMKDDPNKFYKNFVRTVKDGPYKITEAKGENPCQPEPVLGTPIVRNNPIHASGNAQPVHPMYPQPTGKSVGELDTERKVREWSMRRGGFSHDAAAIVASVVLLSKKGEALPDFIQAQIAITDALMVEAEKAEKEYRAKLEGKPEPKEESILAGESGEPSQKKVTKQ